MAENQNPQRFPEIDFLRGALVVLMVFFNWSFALHFLDVYIITGDFFYWRVFPILIGSGFIFLSGLSLILSYENSRKQNVWKKYPKRGAKLFLLGLGITASTYILYPANTIYFGILHLIGFSIFFSPVFLKTTSYNLLFGTLIIIFGFAVNPVMINQPHFLWLGIQPNNFQTFDYWPVLPWLGVFLAGMHLGNFFYSENDRKPKKLSNKFLKLFAALGKNSLFIYLAHQPILLAFLYILQAKII